MDYAMPTAAEIPEVEVILLESGTATDANPLAAKGGGEGGLIATGATLANAIADALGSRGLTTLPLTPERLRSLAADPPRAAG
jgi:carbon-monoxide dehydrogenase large subunit